MVSDKDSRFSGLGKIAYKKERGPMTLRNTPRRKVTDPAVTVELPENMLRLIDRLAHQNRITRSEVIRRLVGNALADEVDRFIMTAPEASLISRRRHR